MLLCTADDRKRDLPLWEGMAGMIKRVTSPYADPLGWVTLPGPRFYISPFRSPRSTFNLESTLTFDRDNRKRNHHPRR